MKGALRTRHQPTKFPTCEKKKKICSYKATKTTGAAVVKGSGGRTHPMFAALPGSVIHKVLVLES